MLMYEYGFYSAPCAAVPEMLNKAPVVFDRPGIVVLSSVLNGLIWLLHNSSEISKNPELNGSATSLTFLYGRL